MFASCFGRDVEAIGRSRTDAVSKAAFESFVAGR
jgi:hypothetical protein